MKTSVQQRAHTNKVANDWQPRPALREAMQLIATIAADDPTTIVDDHAISFENFGKRTTISVAPIGVDTWDGARIEEIITIRTPFTTFESIDEHHCSIANLYATTGAIIRGDNGEDAVISRVALYEGDDVALADLYTPLIATAARLQPIGPISAFFSLQGRQGEYGAAYVDVPHWAEPSYWDDWEFEYARDRMRECGACANGGQGHLAVEFPWEEGAISALGGARTSLLKIDSSVSHPAAGNGLYYRLDLPLGFSEKEACLWAVRMNRIEAGSFDTPPMFGAWCTRPDSGTLSFAGFWPNAMFRPGTAASIAFWSWARSNFARQIIGNLH